MALLFRAAALVLLSTVLAASGCQRPATRATPPAAECIDPAKINPNGICTMDYNPVCGCNGQTYSNACAAGNAGVRSYTAGPCPSRP